MIRLDITGIASIAAIADDISRFAGEVRSLKPGLERAVDEVARPAIRANFESEGGRVGGWAPLNEFYQAQRADQGYGEGPILDRNRGVIGLKYAAQQKNIWQFDGQAGEAWVDSLPERTWYGVVHQFGSEVANIPERPFMVLTRADADRVAEVIGDWYEDRIRVTIGGG